MISVVNKYSYKAGEADFYIGRGSALGNPYTSKPLANTKATFQCASVGESIQSYRIYIEKKLADMDNTVWKEMDKILHAFQQGKNVQLVCFCSPKPCHGDVIKQIIHRLNDADGNLEG